MTINYEKHDEFNALVAEAVKIEERFDRDAWALTQAIEDFNASRKALKDAQRHLGIFKADNPQVLSEQPF